MEQLVPALISAAVVIVGAIATYVTTNLTKKSVQNNSCELTKKLDEIDKKLIEITKNNLKIQNNLINCELKTKKRMMHLENKVNLLAKNAIKKEVKENVI